MLPCSHDLSQFIDSLSAAVASANSAYKQITVPANRILEDAAHVLSGAFIDVSRFYSSISTLEGDNKTEDPFRDAFLLDAIFWMHSVKAMTACVLWSRFVWILHVMMSFQFLQSCG
jgi:hypothetical protein